MVFGKKKQEVKEPDQIPVPEPDMTEHVAYLTEGFNRMTERVAKIEADFTKWMNTMIRVQELSKNLDSKLKTNLTEEQLKILDEVEANIKFNFEELVKGESDMTNEVDAALEEINDRLNNSDPPEYVQALGLATSVLEKIKLHFKMKRDRLMLLTEQINTIKNVSKANL